MKLLWDFRIQTDHHLDHNRPDIVVMEKASRVCQIIDVACPFDTRIAENEREKIDHYQDFKRGNTKKGGPAKAYLFCFSNCIWGTWVVTKNFMMWVTKIGTPKILNLLQRVCLSGTASVEKDPRHLRLQEITR